MGGKNATAENLVSMLPRGRRLLDLFGGGASVTHAALVSGKFEQVIYNDLDPLIVDMLNRLKDEPLAPLRFVGRDEFTLKPIYDETYKDLLNEISERFDKYTEEFWNGLE